MNGQLDDCMLRLLLMFVPILMVAPGLTITVPGGGTPTACGVHFGPAVKVNGPPPVAAGCNVCTRFGGRNKKT